MTDLTPVLRAACPHAAATTIAAVNDVLESEDGAELNTMLRQAHFLAQIIYESIYLTRFVENLNYSAQRIMVVFPHFRTRAVELAHRPPALANACYANRYGNGNEASGDGWRFRGRGLLQHTFRNNYKELADHVGIDLVEEPDKLLDVSLSTKTALYYFISRNCLAAADADDSDEVTKKINGGLSGAALRARLEDQLEHKLNLKVNLMRAISATAPRGSVVNTESNK
jgi:putative chitinase